MSRPPMANEACSIATPADAEAVGFRSTRLDEVGAHYSTWLRSLKRKKEKDCL
jgi:hypothetical protein